MESEQLNKFFQTSKFIQETLHMIKKKIPQQDATSNQNNNSILSDPSQSIQIAVQLRQAFRTLAQGLQYNRKLVQTKKDHLQKSRVFLEGLQYYKNTLKSKIKACQIPAEDLREYLKQPLQVTDWEQDFQPIQKHLQIQLDCMEKEKSTYESLLKKRNDLGDQMKKQQKLYNTDLPLYVQKLYDQVEQTAKVFGCPPQQEVISVKSKILSKIFDLISPLQNIESLQVKYDNGNDFYESFQVEIIENSQYRLYKTAIENKVYLQPKGIKIVFGAMKKSQFLVVGVDRGSDFSTEQIFHRLVSNQSIKPVFSEPNDEYQRNINNKFCYLEWVEKLLCSGVMNGIKFLEVVRQRIFCIQLNKKLPYYFVLSKSGQGSEPNLKKIYFKNIQRITFQEYKGLIKYPQWILKLFNNMELQKQKKLRMTMEEQLQMGQDKNNLNQILSKFSIQEFVIPKLNAYYIADLVCHQQSISLIFIVPFGYPSNESKIKFIKHQKVDLNIGKTLINTNQNSQSQFFNGIGGQLLKIERQINMNTNNFLQGEQNASFRLMLQINRLIYKLWQWGQKNLEKQKKIALQDYMDY